MNKTVFASALSAILIAGAAIAHHGETPVQVGAISVTHSWTQETSASAHSISVYTTIDNHGDEADRLVAASVSFADDGILRAPVLGDDGAVRMVDVPAVEIAPGQSLTLEPGSVHVVLPNVQEAFVEGDHFHMELEFENAGSVRVAVDVDRRPHDHDHGHDHSQS
jgi:periplasmic copper chaperone A